MLVEFDKGIFENADNNNKFIFLYNLALIDRRYNIFTDIEDIKEFPIYLQLTDSDKGILNEYYVKQVQESSVVDYQIMEKTEGENYQLDLAEAIAFLNQPLIIILENSQNDRHFFETVVKNFKKRGKNIARHLTKRWIRYGNAGGCTNIEAFINEMIASYAGLPKNPSFYLRCFVLIDSDSQHPGDVKSERSKLVTFLQGHKVPFHILIKREMENYIPDELFVEADGNAAFKNTYLELDPLQKDYMDIEEGIIAKDLDNIFSPIHILYSNLSDSQINSIRNKGLAMDNYKSAFPLLFASDKVNQENLMARIAHQGAHSDELGNILDKINELI